MSFGTRYTKAKASVATGQSINAPSYIAGLRSPTTRVRIYGEMSQGEPIIGSFLYAVKTLVGSLSWHLSDDDGTTYDISEVFGDVDLGGAICRGIEERIIFGSAVFEKVWAPVTQGKLQLSTLGLRTAPSILEYTSDAEGNLTGVVQNIPHRWTLYSGKKPGGVVQIPRDNLAIINPITELGADSMLRAAYPAYYYASKFREIEAIGADRALVGVPHFVVPPGEITDTMKSRMEDIADQIRVSEGTYLLSTAPIYTDPSTGTSVNTGFDLKLVTADTGPLGSLGNIISRYERIIAMTFLSQFLQLANGSYALSADHSDLFMRSIVGLVNTAKEAMQRDVVAFWNGMTGSSMQLRHGPIAKPTLSQLSALLPGLVSNNLLSLEDAQFAVQEVGIGI